MYEGYFGLIERPFSIAPDPHYLYMSARHKEATAHLSYGLSQGGCFIVLTGEVGTGKTTLCRNLLSDLPDNVDVALILNANINESELLQTVCDELKIAYTVEHSQKQLLDLINQHLLSTFADNRHTVLIIDEAQLLSRDVLEKIRLLTNLETTKSKLLQIILIGQPELNDVLSRNDLRQLAQRVTARYHLGALQRSEIEDYVNFRLSVAGCKQPLFSRQALNKIHSLTEGIPRRINVLADHALLATYSQNESLVDAKTVKIAAQDVFIETKPADRPVNNKWRWWALAGLLLLVNTGAWWLFSKSGDEPTRDVYSEQKPNATPASNEQVRSDSGVSRDQAGRDKAVKQPQETEIVQQNIEEKAQEPFQTAIKKADKDLDRGVGKELSVEPNLDRELVTSTPFNAPSGDGVGDKVAVGTLDDVLVAQDSQLSVAGSAPAWQFGATPESELTDQAGDLASRIDAASSSDSLTTVKTDKSIQPGTVIVSEDFLDASVEAPSTQADAKPKSGNNSQAFGRVLETSADLTGRNVATRALAREWGIELPTPMLKTSCQEVKQHGLNCLGAFKWEQLTRYNRPAILTLSHQNQLHRVVMTKIAGDYARVLVGSEVYNIPVDELRERWEKKATVYWRPSAIGDSFFKLDDKDAKLPTIRRYLNSGLLNANMPLLENDDSNTFDLEMSQKVFALQTRFGITDDSKIGNETYLLMNELATPSTTPVLTNRLR